MDMTTARQSSHHPFNIRIGGNRVVLKFIVQTINNRADLPMKTEGEVFTVLQQKPHPIARGFQFVLNWEITAVNRAS